MLTDHCGDELLKQLCALSADPGATMTFVAGGALKPIGGHILSHASATRMFLRKGRPNIFSSVAWRHHPCIYYVFIYVGVVCPRLITLGYHSFRSGRGTSSKTS